MQIAGTDYRLRRKGQYYESTIHTLLNDDEVRGYEEDCTEFMGLYGPDARMTCYVFARSRGLCFQTLDMAIDAAKKAEKERRKAHDKVLNRIRANKERAEFIERKVWR